MVYHNPQYNRAVFHPLYALNEPPFVAQLRCGIRRQGASGPFLSSEPNLTWTIEPLVQAAPWRILSDTHSLPGNFQARKIRFCFSRSCSVFVASMVSGTVTGRVSPFFASSWNQNPKVEHVFATATCTPPYWIAEEVKVTTGSTYGIIGYMFTKQFSTKCQSICHTWDSTGYAKKWKNALNNYHSTFTYT